MLRNAKRSRMGRLAVVLAAAAMVAAGCGDSDDDGSDVGAGGEGSGGSGTVTLGQVVPLSGFIAEYGRHQTAGVDLAIQRVNEEGGLEVDGQNYQVEVTTYDDECEPTEAVTATTRLIEAGVPVIIGSVCSSNTLAMRPVSERNQVPIITSASTAPDITGEDHPYMFRTVGHIGLMADAVIPYGVEELGLQRWAVLAVNNDFGRSAEEFYGGKAEELGAEVVATEFFEAGTVDFYTTLAQITNQDPDAMFIAGGAAEGAAILRQMGERGMLEDITILAHGLGTQEFAELAGAEVIEGCCYGAIGFSFDALSEESQAFVEENQEAFGSPVNEVVVYSYDAAMAAMRAMEIAGTVEDGEAIRDALDELTVEDYTPLNVTTDHDGRIFDETGQMHPTYVIANFREGEFLPLEG